MTLLLVALLSQAPVDVGSTVGAVELRLPADADQKLIAQVTDLVTIRKGQRLSRLAVRRSIEGLFATNRFSDVVVRAEPTPEGLRVIFELTPKLAISALYVEGNKALSKSELLEASRLTATSDGRPSRSEYWPERVEQAVEDLTELYYRRGYRSALVTPEVTQAEEGVSVAFVVNEGEPVRVTALSLVGDPGLPTQRLVKAVGVEPGDLLDLDRIAAGVDALRSLLRKEHYYRARVEQATALPTGQVVVPVAAGPHYEMVFAGNRSFSDNALQTVVGWAGDEALDRGVTSRLASRVVRFYRFRGFHEAKVQVREVARPGTNDRALGFDIVEGAPLRVTAIDFTGNKAITDAELLDVLKRVIEASAPQPGFEVHAQGDPLNAEGRMPAVFARDLPKPQPETVLVEEAWVDAAKAMTALYKERGYLSAQVVLESVQLQGGTAAGAFAVTEGAQARLRLVQSAGFPVGFRSDVLARVRTGSVFNTNVLERLQQGVVTELNREGYLFASAQASFTLGDGGKAADCLVKANVGPQVRVRKVLAVGQTRTQEELITSQAVMVEGRPLDSESIYATQSNLLSLGIFRTVEVEMLAPETPEPLKTVRLTVRERPRLSGEVGLGYFLAEGPRVVFDANMPNIGGRAINLSAHGQLNYYGLSAPGLTASDEETPAYQLVGGRGNVSLQNRGVLPANIGVRLDLVGERVFRPQFRFTRFAAVPSIDWDWKFELPGIEWARPKLTLQLQDEIEWSSVLRAASSAGSLPVNLADQVRLRFLYGMFALNTVRFAPTLDLRDNAFSPRKGFLLQTFGEVTTAIATEDDSTPPQPVPVGFFKVGALASGYIPLGNRLVLAVSARGGRILRIVPDSVTPPVKRFFLGGATSMRGFNEDQLIAEDLRAQYRDELRECQVLASRDGCTAAAKTILEGRQVPSQGGELFALLKTEVRFPLTQVFDMGLFFETGNLWLQAPSVLSLRAVAGFGLRYETPIGPLALDVAFNPTWDILVNEPWWVVHFNIGVF